LSRRFTLPSFLSPKRSLSSRRSTATAAAAAGTLALAIAAGAAAGTLPGHGAAAAGSTAVGSATVASADAYVTVAGRQHGATAPPAATLSEAQLVIDSQRARFSLQHGEDVTAAKVAASQAAAAKAAAAKTAAAKAAAEARRAAEPSGSPRQIAEQTLRQFGWSSSQFTCLEPLWERESGWDVTAENPSSGAYGIPQALSGSLMASAGPDWQTNPATQIHWGLTYIHGRYGSPCGAWAHEQADGWY